MTVTFSAYVEANSTRSPQGTDLMTLTVGANTYQATVAQVTAYLLALSNTWTALQTFTGGVTVNNTLTAQDGATWTSTGISGLKGLSLSAVASTFTVSPVTAGTLNNVAIGATTASTGAFTTLSLTGAITQGSGGYVTTGVNAFLGTTTSAANFYQISLQNLSATGSSDFVATASDGNDTTHYADFGINGATSGVTPFTNSHAAYLYSVDSELDIGALGTSGIINFYAGGGTATPTQVGSITGTGLNATAVGATTASTGAFTTLSATSTVSGAGFTSLFASPPAIGSTAANTGAFTTLSASSTVSGTGFSTYLASPPAIGGTTPAAITGTTGQFNTSLTLGSGVGGPHMVINGASSGSGAGAAVFFQNAGTTTGAVGHYSSVIGGAYNNDLVLYSTGSNIDAYISGVTTAKFNSAGLSVSSGLANSLTLAGSATNPTIGVSAGNLTIDANTAGLIVTGPSTSIKIQGDNTNQSPNVFWYDTANGTDLKQWKAGVSSSGGNWSVLADKDDNSATTEAYRITRGTTYNVASHTWYTSTTAGTAVQGMVLGTTGFTVGNGTYSSLAALSPGANLWVNYVKIQGNTTGNPSNITFAGSDTNVGGIISSQGTGSILFDTGSIGRTQFAVLDNASGADYVTVTSGASAGAINTNAGNITIGSTGGTTIHTDATLSFPNLTTSTGTAAATFTANSGITGHTSILGWMQITIGGTVRYIPYF